MFTPTATGLHRQEKLFQFNVFIGKTFLCMVKPRQLKLMSWMKPLLSPGTFTRITLCFKLEEQPFFSRCLPDCLGRQEAYRCAAQIWRLLAMMAQIWIKETSKHIYFIIHIHIQLLTIWQNISSLFDNSLNLLLFILPTD